MNQLKIKVGGIKCDNKECDFNDMSVLFEDYANWLNKPCPKCGSNLLTQQDFDSTKMLIDMAHFLDGILPESESEKLDLFRFSANFDGTGRIVFSEIEPIEKDCEQNGQFYSPMLI